MKHTHRVMIYKFHEDFHGEVVAECLDPGSGQDVSVLLRGAVSCSVVQCVVVCCSVGLCVVVRCIVLLSSAISAVDTM